MTLEKAWFGAPLELAAENAGFIAPLAFDGGEMSGASRPVI